MPDSIKINALIPQRPPMLAVDELLTDDDSCEAVSRTKILPDSIFVDSFGQVDEAALFEMMAQTFAAKAVVSKRKGTDIGYLVGVKKMVFYNRPSIGDIVEIHVKIAAEVDDFSVLEGEAFVGQELLAKGNFSVFLPVNKKL